MYIVCVLCQKITWLALSPICTFTDIIISGLQVSTLPDTVSAQVSSPKLGRFIAEDHIIYYVFVEGNVLCSCSSFTKAFFVWFSSHYIFNLEYHKYYHDVALFIQEFIFVLPDVKRKSANYLTVATEILNLTQ